MQDVTGFVLMDRGMEGTRYIAEILANGHPENPVVYYTNNLENAKAWGTGVGADRAAKRLGGVFEVKAIGRDPIGRRQLRGTWIYGVGMIETNE